MRTGVLGRRTSRGRRACGRWAWGSRRSSAGGAEAVSSEEEPQPAIASRERDDTKPAVKKRGPSTAVTVGITPNGRSRLARSRPRNPSASHRRDWIPPAWPTRRPSSPAHRAGSGYALAQMLLGEGFGVTAAARRPEKLDRGRESCAASATGEVEEVAGNMADEEDIQEVVRRHRERFGRLDVLVNNAGVGIGAPVQEIETKRLDMQLDVNLRSMSPLLPRVPRPARAPRGRAPGNAGRGQHWPRSPASRARAGSRSTRRRSSASSASRSP